MLKPLYGETRYLNGVKAHIYFSRLAEVLDFGYTGTLKIYESSVSISLKSTSLTPSAPSFGELSYTLRLRTKDNRR